MPADFIDTVMGHARTAPDRAALVHVRYRATGLVEEAMTYAEIDAAARTVAIRLGEHCSHGDRALLLYPTGAAFAAALLGCMYAGVVPVPSPLPEGTRGRQSRTTSIALDTAARIVLTDAANLADVTGWRDRDGLAALPVLASDTLTADASEHASWQRPEGETLAFLQYTSGSTSDPKGVMVSHDALLANLTLMRDGMVLDSSTRMCSWLPMYHDMGLIGLLLEPMFLGTTVYVMSPMDFLKRPQLWLQIISTHGIEVSSAPNFAYDLAARRLTDAHIAGLDLSRWRIACNGAEPVNASTLDRFAARFAPAGFKREALLPCYGMAETTLFVAGTSVEHAPVITSVDPAALEKHIFDPADGGLSLVSSGRVEGFDIRIVDPKSLRTLSDGHVGEIWLRGESVARGYWNNTEATQDIFRARTAEGAEGFLRTGDLGVLDEGELYITGRIKEMIILNGRNVYPHDVEREITTGHDAFAGLAGCVFTVPAPEEELIVVQEVRAARDEDLATLAALVRDMVGAYLQTRVANVVLIRPGKVRKTTSGKVQRTLMRRLFMDDALEFRLQDLDAPVRARYRAEVSAV
ncbi:fatty acyl-AMP ligase [Streptomyces sp. NBC_00555]|uniref:fatty acyl-AMP ligase n=1 Tax=Streptomyces sp. NBC_00555 TaxID=2903662 RepID=UPI00225A1969|nr:fatty acyl-AMP ligase [Streptomyces sp. NBC_00555]MCX5011205.1 fatty acyl-AMP ligase [Streptomyces sp. NBC_00555]